MKKITVLLFVVLAQSLCAIPYPIESKTLANGLKIIVCEKNTTAMAEIQVWYRVGSKDEWDGVRGMAHLFEHMMFRGSKKFNGNNKPFDVVDRLGGSINAYTSYDRTVYHEQVPAVDIEKVIEMEADRMSNLILDQKILDTERQVVGEELRLDENNWYRRLNADRYKYLYPSNHPYQVDVIGFLKEITSFTTKQCQEFYDKYYSPNNAFIVITGNVKAGDIFSYCEKHFGSITKQLPLNTKKQEPDIFSYQSTIEEMFIDFPVQIYSYVIPSPGFGHKDYYPYIMFADMVFASQNSLLKKRLLNSNLAYQIQCDAAGDKMYNYISTFDIIMQAGVGNAKVKKEIAREIHEIIEEGIDETLLKDYLTYCENRRIFQNYSNEEINSALGLAEYYYRDYKQYNADLEAFKKITQDDFKRIAGLYFNPEKMKVINIKPLDKE